MHRHSPAVIGVTSMRIGGISPSWLEAFRSPSMLVSDISLNEAQLPVLTDPVDVARAWITHPDRAFPDGLVEAAETAIDIAQEHFYELDRLASEAAIAGIERGTVDGARIAHLDALASALNDFSQALRDLLDLDRVDAVQAERCIRIGIASARDGGGIYALVAAIKIA